MNRRTGTHRVVRVGVLLAVLVGFAACSDDEPDKPPATTTSTAKPSAVNKTSDAPRQSNYVGARKDVTDLKCVQDGPLWKVSGTVTNPTNARADYRIFTSFLDSSNETRGLLQTDVPGLAPGEAKPWSGEITIDADDLHCGLRVERTGVNGAPPPTEAPTTTTAAG